MIVTPDCAGVSGSVFVGWVVSHHNTASVIFSVEFCN